MKSPATIFVPILMLIPFFAGTSLFAQYKQSSNDKLVVAALSENDEPHTAYQTATEFIRRAGINDHTGWQKLLSGKCLYKNEPGTFARQWYKKLQDPGADNLVLTEGKSVRNDQRVFYLGEADEAKFNKHVLLIKEKGKWRVLYAKL